MATSPRTLNPLLQRMQQDNIFSGGVNQNMANQVGGTLANFRRPMSQMSGPSIQEQNTMANAPSVMQAGMPQDGAPMNLPAQNAMNTATGNVIGGRISPTTSAAAASLPVQTQVAGVLSGMADQAPLVAYQQRLMDAGINLNPEGQSAGDYQQNVTAAQGIYNNVFGAGMPQGGGRGAFGQPSTSYAPTGLREQAIAAQGAPVWGQGDVVASARPNAQGGTAFSLMQASKVGGVPGMSPTPTNPIAPETPFQKMAGPQAAQPSAYEQNAAQFKNHIVAQQTQAGLSKGIEPGYMIDPEKPNAVKPIPGSKAELEYNKAQREMATATKKEDSAVAQGAEKANLIVDTVGKALEKTGYFNQATGFIPFTEGADLQGLVDTVKANIGFSELNAMRQASPTGGALGQVAVRELEFLQAALGNLSLKQSPKQLQDNLKGVTKHYNNWLKTTKGVNPDSVRKVGRFEITEE